MKKLTFLLGLALTACQTAPVEDSVFNLEKDNKPEIIDVFEDTNYGL